MFMKPTSLAEVLFHFALIYYGGDYVTVGPQLALQCSSKHQGWVVLKWVIRTRAIYDKPVITGRIFQNYDFCLPIRN